MAPQAALAGQMGRTHLRLGPTACQLHLSKEHKAESQLSHRLRWQVR